MATSKLSHCLPGETHHCTKLKLKLKKLITKLNPILASLQVESWPARGKGAARPIIAPPSPIFLSPLWWPCWWPSTSFVKNTVGKRLAKDIFSLNGCRASVNFSPSFSLCQSTLWQWIMQMWQHRCGLLDSDACWNILLKHSTEMVMQELSGNFFQFSFVYIFSVLDLFHDWRIN